MTRVFMIIAGLLLIAIGLYPIFGVNVFIVIGCGIAIVVGALLLIAGLVAWDD